MPRRQPNPFDNLITPTDEAANKSLSLTLSTIDVGLHQRYAQTPEQMMIVRDAKNFFKRVGAVLDNFFACQSPPDFSAMDKMQRQEIMDEAYFYLSLYSLIYFHWDAVKKELAKHKESPISQAFAIGGDQGEMLIACGTRFNELESPAAVTSEIMKSHLIGMLAPAYSEENIGKSSYEVRSAIARLEKARKASAPKTLRTVVEIEQRENLNMNPWAILETMCLVAAQNSKPNGTNRAVLKNALEAVRIREMHIKRRNHSNAKSGRNVWRDGHLVESAEYKLRAHR